MSIDGKWIRKNEAREFREGPFVEENINSLKQSVQKKFYEASLLFKDVEFFLSKDTFDVLFPEDSFEIGALDIYSSLYKNYADFDLNDTKSMRNAIDGFDNLIPAVRRIVDRMKIKFYPDINSRDGAKSINAQRKYRMDRAKFNIEQMAEVSMSKGINFDDNPSGKKPR